MKKFFSGIFLTLILMLSSFPVHAANIQIKIDDVVIASDVNPEINNNRIMVPLRVISENLAAKVNWSNSEVTLTKNDMKVRLKLNSNTAVKNGKTELLDAKPYIKNNRIFVPMRFLAETFGCNVNYKNSTVTVDTKPLVIDNVKINAIQEEVHMTMGGVVRQIKGNVYNKEIYDVFIKNRGSKVEAPANYSWHYDIDTPGAYYKNGQYDFLNQEGNSVKRFDIYSLIKSFPAETLAGYQEVLIYDATENQWYVFTDHAFQSINQLIDTANKNGFLKIISNTAV
ncbi:copper amine oxidase N-terminal domain-containing protein [Lysinibacillus yapensis]|uniref:Copper amine oxidase N-terminal domain-containing protein n=1 Tax=Ureibacillus yapensis TaxID=2304605 RepID=A0A396S4F7_9BACL|nr:stalk domain-containing protein [Lysinibacillus yapensis]RHW34026.1 copper amine oxidase N-terminal domain-containing protein [Lysinibacillus yapensis]